MTDKYEQSHPISSIAKVSASFYPITIKIPHCSKLKGFAKYSKDSTPDSFSMIQGQIPTVVQ